jgi:hypothetical protein
MTDSDYKLAKGSANMLGYIGGVIVLIGLFCVFGIFNGGSFIIVASAISCIIFGLLLSAAGIVIKILLGIYDNGKK